MSHNFRAHLRPDLQALGRQFLFVSKAGTAGAPGTPDAPLAHPDQAAALASPYTGGVGQGTYPGANNDAGRIIVVGSGEYQGQQQASSNLLVADGPVVWNVNGDLLLGTKWDFGEHYVQVQGITFRGINRWRPNISGGGTACTQPGNYQFCTLDFAAGGPVPNVFFYGNGCAINEPYNLVDCVVRGLNGPAGSFERTLLLGSAARDCWRLRYCYVDSNSVVELRGPECLSPEYFFACNITGLIRLKGDAFGFVGLDAFKQNYNLTARADLIAAPPEFGSVAAEDFSLRPGSPHLAAGIGPSHLGQASGLLLEGPVGPVGAGTHTFLDAATGTRLPLLEAHNLECADVAGQRGLRVPQAVGGELSGWYKTGLHFVSDSSQEIRRIDFLGGLRFDTDAPAAERLFDPNAPEPGNREVPAAERFAPGAAGRNPHRLTLQLRWGNKPAPNPAAPQDTDFANAGQYLAFEWGTELLYNPLRLLGTGAPDFDPAAPGPDAPRHPQARYVQYWVTLRNDYFSH